MEATKPKPQKKEPALQKKDPAAQKKGPALQKKESAGPAGNVAVILIRSTVRLSSQAEDALKSLKLLRKNTCSVYPKTTAMGAVKKLKDYVTYGDIDDETFKLMQEKRGQKDKDGKYKNHYHLSPPRGGFERKGIKRTYDQGGALGNRGKDINALIKRMI
jgi:large subunit ribosomal protein L30